jgi:hypothetical protein
MVETRWPNKKKNNRKIEVIILTFLTFPKLNLSNSNRIVVRHRATPSDDRVSPKVTSPALLAKRVTVGKIAKKKG